MKVIRAKSAGFCWELNAYHTSCTEESEGGRRRVYTDGPLIHNRQMMDALGKDDIRKLGITEQKEINVKDSDEKESVVVVRAHGISPQRRDYLKVWVFHFVMVHVQMLVILPGK